MVSVKSLDAFKQELYLDFNRVCAELDQLKTFVEPLNDWQHFMDESSKEMRHILKQIHE